jgi:hypothetical protein
MPNQIHGIIWIKPQGRTAVRPITIKKLGRTIVRPSFYFAISSNADIPHFNRSGICARSILQSGMGYHAHPLHRDGVRAIAALEDLIFNPIDLAGNCQRGRILCANIDGIHCPIFLC